MKTVICCVNSQYIHSSLAPWCLLAGVEAYAVNRQNVCVREATINQLPADVVTMLREEQAEAYAFCTYIWNIRFLKEMLPLLKKALPSCTVILGGPEVSFCPETVLDTVHAADYILAGEGEEAFPLLLDTLSEQRIPAAVPGITYRADDGLHSTPAVPLKQLPPAPYTPAYLAALKGRIAYMEGSRGCPFSCAFCLSGREDKLRLFPVERVKKDILLLANSGAKTVKFVDRTFNCNQPRCREILSFILSEYGKGIPQGICFHFEVAADLFDEETLQLLSTAPKGLFQMEAGLQTFHPASLTAVSRKTDLERLCGNIRRILRPGNIHLHIDLIAGLPKEDIAIFRDSFNSAFALRPHMLQLGFLKLLYGSALRRQIAENGYVYGKEAPYEVCKSHWMHAADFARLHRIEDIHERLYNSGRFTLTLEYVLVATAITPFDLFDGFAGFLQENAVVTDGIALDKYTEYVLRYFSGLPGIDKATLRDMLICDSLQSHRANCLPACLLQRDKRVAAITRQLAHRRGSGVKRGVALLQTPAEQVAVVEYRVCDPVTGRYPLEVLPLSAFSL